MVKLSLQESRNYNFFFFAASSVCIGLSAELFPIRRNYLSNNHDNKGHKWYHFSHLFRTESTMFLVCHPLRTQ